VAFFEVLTLNIANESIRDWAQRHHEILDRKYGRKEVKNFLKTIFDVKFNIGI
jgi:hypothetical protein